MIEFQASIVDFYSYVNICARTKTSVGYSYMRPTVFDLARDGEIVEPAMRIEFDDAQRLMDALWHAGLRPTEGRGSAGALAATQRHLDDMRHLVFKGEPPK